MKSIITIVAAGLLASARVGASLAGNMELHRTG
jgi:hypothetical protein